VDVRQFFPSVDHEILKARIATKLDDPDIIRLIDLILASGDGVLDEAYEMVFFQGDDLLAAARPRGLPIGNLTSQFWANVYLNAFDHFVKRELGCGGYVRYVDDLLLFGEDKRELWDWLRAIETRLAALRLTMHEGTHPRPVAEGVPFLGFVVFPDRRRLKRRKGIHFQRRLARLIADHAERRRPLSEISATVGGWVNHTRFGNTVGLRKAVLRRAVIWPARDQRQERAPRMSRSR
jgi:RNA-directed DNA polymerase